MLRCGTLCDATDANARKLSGPYLAPFCLAMAHPIYDIILALLVSSIIALLLTSHRRALVLKIQNHSISSPRYLRPIYEHIEVIGWSVGHLSRRELKGVSQYDNEVADFDNSSSPGYSALLSYGEQSR